MSPGSPPELTASASTTVFIGCPGVERLAGVVELEDPDVEACHGYPASDLYAHGVVAAVRVTETDDECLARSMLFHREVEEVRRT